MDILRIIKFLFKFPLSFPSYGHHYSPGDTHIHVRLLCETVGLRIAWIAKRMVVKRLFYEVVCLRNDWLILIEWSWLFDPDEFICVLLVILIDSLIDWGWIILIELFWLVRSRRYILIGSFGLISSGGLIMVEPSDRLILIDWTWLTD